MAAREHADQNGEVTQNRGRTTMTDPATTPEPADTPGGKFGRRLLARTYQPGRMRAVTLAPGPPRAAHVDPDLPRAVFRWDGTGWRLVRVVPDLAAAQDLMRPETPGPEPW